MISFNVKKKNQRTLPQPWIQAPLQISETQKYVGM